MFGGCGLQCRLTCHCTVDQKDL